MVLIKLRGVNQILVIVEEVERTFSFTLACSNPRSSGPVRPQRNAQPRPRNWRTARAAEQRGGKRQNQHAPSWGPREPAMEVGGGLQEGRSGELESLLEAIKSSEVRHHPRASRRFSTPFLPFRPAQSPPPRV
jgi:hypothetical protein